MTAKQAPVTAKQTLRAHLESHHTNAARIAKSTRGASVAKSATLHQLQIIHMELHHRYSSTGKDRHWHGIRLNVLQSERPEGWYDGRHVRTLDDPEHVDG